MKNNPWQNIKPSNNKNLINGILADKNHLLEFYWAKDILGNFLFVITASSKIILTAEIPKLHGIDITVGESESSNQLVFTLVSKEDKEIFYTLCSDLIDSTKSLQSEDYAITAVMQRLEKWQYFLRNRRKPIDKKQLKGLIGELVFLKEYLLVNYSAEEALTFWKAPLQSVHDFELSSFSVEVKTKSSVNTVRISSYEQLFSELEHLLLYVVTLNESSSSTPKAFNIDKLVEEIKVILENALYRERFENLLMQYGYVGGEEYKKHWFVVVADEFYEVSKGFPRINKIPDGVEDLTYRINLEKCKNYKAEENILKKAGLTK